MRNPLIAAMLVGLALGASGCARIKQNSGYLVDETLFTSVQPGVDNRESVAKTLGRPTFASQFDGNEWYYVSRNTGQWAFLQPKVTAQSILVVTFDKDGNVAKVERRGPEQIVNVSPSKDKTPTLGREESLLDELFGNIGAVGSGGALSSQPSGRDGPR